MSKPDPQPTFAVIGTGNSGQTFTADLVLRGYSVNLAEVPEFAATLEAIEEAGGIELSGEAGEGFAEPNMMTTDIRRAIAGVDVVIIGGSAHAHEPICRELMESFEDGQYVLMTSNFGALRFRRWKEEAGVTTDVTPVESMSLPYATRALSPGRVSCYGVKRNLPIATLPARWTGPFLDLVGGAFPRWVAAENVWSTSVGNLNPVVHPPMVLLNAGRIESTGGKGWNLYADGATESVGRLIEGIDVDRRKLLEAVNGSAVSFKEMFEAQYVDYGVGGATLSETLRTSVVHGDPTFEAPDSVNTRYLGEDIPFGLTPWSSVARMWGIEVPHIDAVIRIASTLLDIDGFNDGITAKTLGISGMTPGELAEFLR
jgi:opine dehydrogenase